MVNMQEYKIIDIFRFLLVFVFVFLFLWFFVDLRELESFIISKLLNCEIQKNFLICNGKIFEIVKECTGILSISFLRLFLIFDYKRVNKVYVILGIIFLFIWNIIRILLVIYLNGSDLIHSSTWFISVLFVLVFIALAYFKKR